MGYSDQKFYARPLTLVANAAVATGTATVSGTSTLATAFPLKKYKKRTAINFIRALTVTAPAANTTVPKISVLNGTNTLATIAPSATLNAWADGTQVANVTATATQTTTLANGSTVVSTVTTTTTQAILGTDTAPSITLLAVSTASGANYGAYQLYFEEQEQFDN